MVDIFVALDALSLQEAIRLVDKVGSSHGISGRTGFKINDLLYDPAIQQLVQVIEGVKAPLFVDAKLHDIPNTVFNSARRIMEELRPNFLTVHASGGIKMIKAARMGSAEVAGFHNLNRPSIVAVTVLTSLGSQDVEDIYSRETESVVKNLAKQAERGQADGIVCSPMELELLRESSIRFRVVPGIRPAWCQTNDDQKRVSTPAEAVKRGATHLVIGRPIVRAPDSAEAVARTLEEIDKAQEEFN